MNLPEQKRSDIKNPLRWFDSFISNNKPYRFRDDFYAAMQKDYEDSKINYFDNSVSVINFTTSDGYEHKTTIRYSHFLKAIIEYEVNISKDLLKEQIELIHSKDELIICINKNLNQLEHCINMLKRNYNTSIREFDFVPLGVYKIVDYLKSAHTSFLPNPLPRIFEEATNPPLHLFSNIYKSDENVVSPSNLKKDSNQSKNDELESSKVEKNYSQNNKRVVNGFEWLGDNTNYAYNFYNILIDYEAIKKDEIDYHTFFMAFNNEEFKEPLKIRWHLESIHKSFKAPLFRMLIYLYEDLKVIKKPDSNADFARKVNQIFVDGEGKPFKALDVAFNDTGKKFPLAEIPLKEALDLCFKKPNDKVRTLKK